LAERAFKVTEIELRHVARCLRFIESARKTLAAKGPGNEAICTELEKSAKSILQVINRLPEIKP
jgi:hypothetical protein